MSAAANVVSSASLGERAVGGTEEGAGGAHVLTVKTLDVNGGGPEPEPVITSDAATPITPAVAAIKARNFIPVCIIVI